MKVGGYFTDFCGLMHLQYNLTFFCYLGTEKLGHILSYFKKFFYPGFKIPGHKLIYIQEIVF